MFFTVNSWHINFRTFILCLPFLLYAQSSDGWYDNTHLAVAKFSGYHKWYHAAGADITKIKAGSIESYNHFYNNPDNVEITPAFILKQVADYDNPGDKDGHLYGAIIASLRKYMSGVKAQKYSQYHLAFAVHYITDLSQPLHNIPYDRFNQTRHNANDGIVDKEILDHPDKLEKYLYPVRIRRGHFEEDMAKEIAIIANRARALGYTLKKEQRNMTEEEAYIQLGQSASLLKAVIDYLGQTNILSHK